MANARALSGASLRRSAAHPILIQIAPVAVEVAPDAPGIVAQVPRYAAAVPTVRRSCSRPSRRLGGA